MAGGASAGAEDVERAPEPQLESFFQDADDSTMALNMTLKTYRCTRAEIAVFPPTGMRRVSHLCLALVAAVVCR